MVYQKRWGEKTPRGWGQGSWALAEQGRAEGGLTIDLSQGDRVDEVYERLLFLHLSLLVPPLQVPVEQGAV